ncbi:MAG: L,D-transpeptidase family protein [Anaerolineae bacterium]|nr:L,D-transpeptidase family protein [Anaerolineae bacterium]MCO5206325.1 L,D-transpeptidase family protein [Anaerolineae bacterium]
MEEALNAIESGDYSTGRRLLRNILQEDPDNYRAWLWLAGITESPSAALNYVQLAQDIAPQDETVKAALVWAKERVAAQSAETVPPPTTAQQVETVARPVTVAAAATTTPPARPVRDTNSSSTPPPPAAPSTAKTNDSLKWIRRIAIVLVIVMILWLVYLFIREIRSGQQFNEWFDQTLGTQLVSAASELEIDESVAVEPNSAEAITYTNLPPKAISGSALAALPRWTPTPTPTPTPLPPTPTPIPPTATPEPIVATADGFDEWRWVDVDLTNQTLIAYENNIPVFSTYISSGMYQYPTVTGQFRIYYRLPEQDMNGYLLGYDYYVEDVPYVQYFYEDYALHGAYWHNNFGIPMSHGCVNLSPIDAQWLYNFTDVGTLVNVHY